MYDYMEMRKRKQIDGIYWWGWVKEMSFGGGGGGRGERGDAFGLYL